METHKEQDSYQHYQHTMNHHANHHQMNNNCGGDQHIRVGNYAVQQPRKGFKGDSEGHVDELISACQAGSSGVVHEYNNTAEVGGLQMMKKERTLVPYFGGNDAMYNTDGVLAEALEWPDTKRHHKNRTPNNKNAIMTANGTPGHHKKHGKKQVSEYANNKPPKVNQYVDRNMHQQRDFLNKNTNSFQRQQKAHGSGKFAGPGFTVSPVPEKLPMPSQKLFS